MADFVRVKGLGNVPIEAFPKGYRVRTKDGRRLSPSQIPSKMIVNMKDETKATLIENMKRRGLKLVDETQKIGGRTFLVKRELNGSITKTDVNALPKYADLPAIRRGTQQRSYSSVVPQGGYKDEYFTREYPFSRSSTVVAGSYVTGSYAKYVPADKYKSYQELEKGERLDVDYKIEKRVTGRNVLVLAIHGGATEPGTTELASAIANADLNYYSLISLKATDNADLHVTSTRFDEPAAIQMVNDAYFVLSLHGASDKDDAVYLGGRDTAWGAAIKDALESKGITVKTHTNADMAGAVGTNIANRGIAGQGVQLELGRGLRRKLFEGGLGDREHPTELFKSFVDAIRSTLVTLSDDPIVRVTELAEHIVKATVAIDETLADVMDFHEEIIPKLVKTLNAKSDDDVDAIYKSLEENDTAFIDKLPDTDKAKLNAMDTKLSFEKARISRVTKRIERIVSYHIHNSKDDVLLNLCEVLKDVLPAAVGTIEASMITS